MKKIIYAIILGIALVNACYSEDEGTNLADRIGSIEVYGDIGLSSALSPEKLKDYRSSGFNFGIGAGKEMISIGKFDISVGGRIDYSSLYFYVDKFLKEEKPEKKGYSITGGETSILTLLGTAKAILPGMISPYFYGGMGFFRISTKDATMYKSLSPEEWEIIPGSSENTLGISLGAGVEAGTPFGLFAEGQYIIGFTENSTQLLFPIKLGVIYKWE